MRDAGSVRLEDLHVGRVEIDGVRDQCPAVQNSERFNQPGGCHVARAHSVVIFEFRLGEVHHQWCVEFIRERARGFKIVVIIRIDGVRGDGWDDERVVLVLVEKLSR